jgi:hypothetical protein
VSSGLDALLISLYVLVDDPHTGPPSAAPCRRKTPPFHAAQYFAPHSPKDPLRAESISGGQQDPRCSLSEWWLVSRPPIG